MLKRALTGLAAAGLLAALSGTALAEGITKEQGDIIINELRAIRLLLGKQVQQQAPAKPEAPERVRVKLGKEFSLGKADAPVVMLEYTDYQCPFCNRFFTGTFPELKKQYIDTGKMRFITRDFPLPFHPHAMKAAEAAHCAGEQGKFWPMKDALMTNSAKLSPELINTLAGEQGVEMGKFRACIDSDRYASEIKQEVTAAQGIGISGTPSFVIGKVSGDYLEGYLVVGAQPFESFDAVAKQVLSGK
ncbi:DsbA family protein [Geomonas sp.]|uniref:DsbA family protein n=1 Tax=Geomonas sp. TaxID=2651584 RepID=UPI002B46E9A3|nr:DsbA family protein [Geomonas sp.]HJV34079.1 DsbA family protein [Geomonas sp.]